MNNNLDLPLWVQARYDENGVFSKFQSDVRSASDYAERQFSSAFGEIGAQVSRALSVQRNQFGSLDLGVDELRAAASAQEARAIAAREVAAATRAAAAAEGDYSQSARLTIAAADALAREEREAAAAALAHAEAAEQVQLQLNKEKSATDALVLAQRRGTDAYGAVVNSQRAARFASLQLGQQMQDVVVQTQLGTNGFIIFSQQVPQAAFALSGLADNTNKTLSRIGSLATFLSGPWGAAIFAATAILGPFIYDLIATSDAADQADAALKRTSFSSYALSDAQSILGGVMDLTTGKINTQSEALLNLARAQAVAGRIEAQQRAAAAQALVADASEYKVDVGFLKKEGLSVGPFGLRATRERGFEGDIASAFQDGSLNAQEAIRELDKLAESGLASEEAVLKVSSAIANLGVERENIKVFEELQKALEGDDGAVKGFLKDKVDKARGGRSSDAEARREQRETERLARISDSAAESIARVNEQFDDQPRLVDKSAQAVRRLQAIIDELNDPKNAETPRRAELVAEALDAQAVAARAVATEIERYGEATDRNLDIMRLQAAGLDEQAQILAEIARLDEQLGLDKRSEALREQKADLEDILVFETLTAEQRAQTEAAIASVNTELEENGRLQQRRNDEAEYRVQTERRLQQQIARTNDLMRAQLNVLDTAREGLIDLLSGRSTDLFGDLKQALADLKGARLFDQIFGDAFDVLEDELRGRSPLGRAAKRLEAGVDEATTQTDNLATAAEIAAERILAATDPLVAVNDNPVPGTSGVGPNGEIVVTGERGGKVEIEQLSVSQIADKMADAIVSPLLEGMDDIFGTAFTQQMAGVLKGALSGYIQAGTVGGVIGGLKGISDEVFGAGSGVSGALGDALGGAQFGTQLAGLADMFGIGMSNDGAAIGGAIGAALQFPGGQIIGSIAGGLLGGLFKSNKTARALLTGGDDMAVAGAWTSKYGIAEGLGGTVLDALNRIADELGGDVGSFYTSIGVRGGDYRVNTDNSSLKIKNGAVNFGDDQEAATRFAILDAITDGAIKGISDAEQRLLREGKDLDSALQDVFDFRSVFDRLKQYKDPVGYALDQVDKEFEDLIDLFERAGASAEEFAQLEELYGIERAKAIEEASERVTASLKSLLDELTIGDSGLSLRSRQQNALAEYQPLAERVAAGDTTAYDDYADAARSLLDIERQMFGSTQAYFDRLDEVTNLTRERVDGDSNIASIAANRESPFDSAGRVKDSIDSQTGEITNRLDAVNDNLITIIRQMGFAGTGGGTFDYRAWYEAYAF